MTIITITGAGADEAARMLLDYAEMLGLHIDRNLATVAAPATFPDTERAKKVSSKAQNASDNFARELNMKSATRNTLQR